MAHPTRIAPLAAFLLAAAPPAFGANPIQGGPGGGPFRLQCGNGQYVTGVEVHSGTLIDSIAAYCSFYDAGKRMFSAGVPRLTKPAGGPGGSGRAARCADNQALVQIKYGFTRNGNKPQLPRLRRDRLQTPGQHRQRLRNLPRQRRQRLLGQAPEPRPLQRVRPLLPLHLRRRHLAQRPHRPLRQVRRRPRTRLRPPPERPVASPAALGRDGGRSPRPDQPSAGAAPSASARPSRSTAPPARSRPHPAARCCPAPERPAPMPEPSRPAAPTQAAAAVHHNPREPGPSHHRPAEQKASSRFPS